MSFIVDHIMEMILQMFDRTILILGPFLLVGGLFLVNFVGVLFYYTPFIDQEKHSPIVVFLVDLLGIWIWFNILFNWFLCFKTNPGVPPSEIPLGEGGKSCHKCSSFKPQRAHHCHVCQKCVLQMDHHCPWMANCIGYFNYRYFVLTLFYLTVGCLFCSIITAEEFSIPNKLLFSPNGMKDIPKLVFFTFFLCCSAGSAVGLLLCWHLYLILSGQTTIEFYQRRSKPNGPNWKKNRRTSWYKLSMFQFPLESNDYDLGPTQNWIQVFGESKIPLAWALPSLKPPPGDGIHWKNCRSLVSLV
jgi:palmitoyltransferase